MNRLRHALCQVAAVISAGFIVTVLPLERTEYTSRACFASEARPAGEQWKLEFNEVCSKTTDSMSLSREELRSLITRCEKLKPVIEELEESTRKVYRKRLEMCRNLLVFVLESKK